MRIIKYIFVLLLALISKRKLKKLKQWLFIFILNINIYIYILLRPDNEYGSLFFYINFIFILWNSSAFNSIKNVEREIFFS